MAAFVNDRYVRLINTTPRYLPASVGVQSGAVTIYRRTSSASAPALPSATATFTFSTGALTGLTNSWTTTLPPLSDGAYLWSSVVYFGSSSSATYDVTAASWPAARLIYDAATIIQAQSDATAANTALTTIADDNKLSKGEKPEAILRWNTIVGEVSGLQTQADALVVSRTSFDSAYTTLLNYLNSINTTPAWTDVLVDTPITGTTFRTNFLNYYNAKATLLNNISLSASRAGGTPGKGMALNSDPACMDPSAWTGTIPVTITNGAAGNNVLRSSTALAAGATTSKSFPISGNKTYRISCKIRSSGGSKTAYLRAMQYAANGTTLLYYVSGYENAAVPVGPGFTQWSTTFTSQPTAVIGAIELDMNWTGTADGNYVEAQDVRWEDVTDVNAAKAAADAANTALGLIADDNVLSRAEKPAVLREWTTTDAEAPLLRNQADALGVSKTAYNAAKQALSDYLTSIPNGWATLNTDSAIVGADFRTNWNNYYAAKLDLLNAIAAKAAFAPSLVVGGRNTYSKTTGIYNIGAGGSTLVGRSTSGFTLNGTAANTGVMRMGNVISKNGQWTVSFDLQTSFNTPPTALNLDLCDGAGQNVNPTTAVQHFSLTFTVGNWSAGVYNFIDFNNLSGQDYIFTNFKVEEGNKATSWTPSPEEVAAASAAAQTAADAANAAITAISSDNVLSKGEKPQVILDWETAAGEKAGLDTQAGALGIDHTSYDSYYDALANYLVSLRQGGAYPLWNDTSGDNPIVGADFRAAWNNYYTAKQALINAMAAKAAFAPSAIIGGANLYPDGGFERGTHPCSSVNAIGGKDLNGSFGAGVYSGSKSLFFDGTAADMYIYIGGPLCPVKAGKQYVFSFMHATAGAITADGGNGSSSFLRLSDGNHVLIPHPVVVTGGAWMLCEMLWTCPAGITTVEARFGLRTSGYSWMTVDCIQMEEGNKRTQWTPALVDLQADAQAKADAAQSAAVSTAAAAAQAKADLAETTAKAYADGIVTSEEARAIADATAKANAAQSAAQSAAAADATAKANVAATTANWSGVANNDGNKPANGATVGAPSGTNVGSTPATTVESKANGAIPDAAGTVATGNIANDGVSGVDVFSTIPGDASAQFVVSVDSKVLVLASIANNPGSGTQGYNIDKLVSGTTWTLGVASYYTVNANSSNLFTLTAGTYRFYPMGGSGYVTNVTVLKIKK